MDPWKFKRKFTQQSGSEDELGSVVLVLIGQHACELTVARHAERPQPGKLHQEDQ